MGLASGARSGAVGWRICGYAPSSIGAPWSSHRLRRMIRGQYQKEPDCDGPFR